MNPMDLKRGIDKGVLAAAGDQRILHVLMEDSKTAIAQVGNYFAKTVTNVLVRIIAEAMEKAR